MNLKMRHCGRRNVPLLVVLLGALFCAALLPAQETAGAAPAQREKQRVSRDEAVDLAIKNNLSLESARVASGTKKRASDLSWNQFIPSVTVAGTLSRDNEKTEAVEKTFPVVGAITISSAQPQWHVVGSIQTSLNISVAMFENMKRLRLDYEGGLLNYEKAKTQLERDVRKAYNSMLLLQENIALLRGSFTNAERQVQMAQANYNAGLAPELTLLQARVAMENLRPTIDQAENGLRLSMAQFAMYLGLPYDTPFELEPVESGTSFISLDVSELISKAASGKPDIQELRQQILMLNSARKAQVFSLLPSLQLGWTSNSALTKDPWENSWFGDADDWYKSGSFTITLGLRLHSLLPFSQDFQGIKNLDDQIRTANIGLAQLVQGTEIEIYNTVLSLDKTRISTQALAQTANLAERSYQLTEQAYRAGLQDLFQVQSAELSLRQARVQMLEQQFNYLNGLIDLEYSIGVPFGTLSPKGDK